VATRVAAGDRTGARGSAHTARVKDLVALLAATSPFLVLLTLWQRLPEQFESNGFQPKIIATLGRPSDIVGALPDVAREFSPDLLIATALTAVGLVASAGLAIVVVAVELKWPRLRPLLKPCIVLPQAIPFFWLMIVTLAASHTVLVSLNWGRDAINRSDPVLLVMGVMLTTAFPAVVACRRATYQIESELLALIDSWKLSNWHKFRRILWPYLLSGSLSGLSAAAPWALSAFFFAASTLPDSRIPTVDLGKLIVGIKGTHPVEYITASIVWATAASVLLYTLVRQVYRRVSQHYFGKLFREEISV
jgi:ABC-type nitrate/sulfonate/bicarbonate transport system permease component